MKQSHSFNTPADSENTQQQLIQRLCTVWLGFGFLALLLGGEDALAASIGPWWFWAFVPPAVWFACVFRGANKQKSVRRHGRIQAVRRR